MQTPLAVTIGFATLDFVVVLAEPFAGPGTRPGSGTHPTGTRPIEPLSAEAWPRAGGAALYTCRQFASAGIDAAPITWLGRDDGAEYYKTACREHAVGLDGIALHRGATASCILIYQPDGDDACLFSQGSDGAEQLTENQKRILRAASLAVIAVGPPQLNREILSLIRPDATVAWIAKKDPVTCPELLSRRCAARANYIFCNASERRFVDASIPAPARRRKVIVETRGSDGVLVENGDERFFVPVGKIQTADTTGAGDTFAGAMLACLLNGEKHLKAAVEAGIGAANALLRERSENPDTKYHRQSGRDPG